MKRILSVLMLIMLAVIGVVGWGYANAISDPVVRRASFRLSEWPVGTAPLQVILLSDLHVGGPDMPPDRLRKIIAQVNALKPQMVLIAGDFVSDKRVATQRYSVTEAVAPLKELRSSLGTVAVLGNHDHWRNAAAFRIALPDVGVTVLTNHAVRRGPLVVAGADDDFTKHADLAALSKSITALPGPVIVLSHSPDIVPELPARMSLVLAGHTHCGQISLPIVGRFATMSRFGDRYACGIVREGGRTTVIGAGLGTSLLPIRFGVPPDLWLLTLRGTR